ncbi:DnaB-like helicase C-terminal domain-containing protein [Propionispora hippei]|uniref:Twinkle protein n=1 Tax=Propionispora hippei DSM 15287 TaxID=1123003 RepID=A0A1M6MES9_9FIRM|nr:DnaB-like helicase C-terminal domain-containing protein [Propionispora hippei]SHJ82022.1 twinkle protein [Propionispora hippei DSM 15287]
MEDSTIIRAHIPCPDCGSSDAMCEYSDGHTFCFSCETHHHGNDTETKGGNKTVRNHEVIPLDSLTLDSLRARGITQETCAKYGYYKTRINNEMAQVACYYSDSGELVGQKVRFKDKRFSVRGEVSDRFFGQHLWHGGGKKLVITEGEIDCLTVSQVQGNKYPVVSIPNGAKSAKRIFKAQMEWLNSFEQVIVMFDMDERGREAVSDVEGILKPGKLYIATLPLKDPNECLLNDQADAIVKAIWNAKVYKPDGIVNGADLWNVLENEEEEEEGYSLPWDIDLQKMTLGLRKGELVVLTAGTGVGKTTFVRQIAHNFGVKQNLKVGMMMLEENVKRTAKGLMSIEAGKRLHINRKAVTPEEYKEAFEKTLGTGNFIFHEHFGSIEGDNLLNKMRYMVVGEGCDFIILDHVSIAVSGLEGDNERKLIDILMTTMRSLVEETGVGLVVISHLKRPDGQQSHEEGGVTSLSQLRGSGAIAQLADTVIGLERNQQAEGKEKNLVRIRLLKCRFTGETGIAGYLWYNKETDRLEGVDKLSDYLEENIDLGDNEDTPF